MKVYPLHQSPLYCIHSRAKLAEMFGLTRAALDRVLAEKRPYSAREIEILRNGKVKRRFIQEPRGAYRPIHARVKKLLSRIAPPDFLFCPVKRRSYVSNAAQHVGACEIRTLDIQSYFPSTPRHRIFWFFHTVMHCSSDVASILAQLLTADGRLATGSTVSPILSFYAFYDMWIAVSEVAKRYECTLTIYIDDITISGRTVPGRAVWEIKRIIYARGLRYHKERRYSSGCGEVTGVLLRGGTLMLPNRQHKKVHDIRAELRTATDDIQIASLHASLRGLLNQQKQITGWRPIT